MDQEPKLRSIPPGGFARPATSDSEDSPRGRLNLGLGIALAIALVLLLWSYVSLSSRIGALENEAQNLRSAVAERDDLIASQRTRLDEVHGRLQELLQLVEQPLPGAGSASTAEPGPPPENP